MGLWLCRCFAETADSDPIFNSKRLRPPIIPSAITPTVADPECTDARRVPWWAGDPDRPIHDDWIHAYRAAATFMNCPQRCPKKDCRAARGCLNWPPNHGDANIDFTCASPDWHERRGDRLAEAFHQHASNTIRRHAAWKNRPEPDWGQ